MRIARSQLEHRRDFNLAIRPPCCLADEAGQLAQEGVPYVQVDAPTYTWFADSSYDDWYSAHGIDKLPWL